MMEKLRKKLNNSASLGKTLSRAKQQQLHFSYFMEPREFDHLSVNDPRENHPKDANLRLIDATPKILAAYQTLGYSSLEELLLQP